MLLARGKDWWGVPCSIEFLRRGRKGRSPFFPRLNSEIVVNKLCGNGGHVGGIYSINIITMPRLNCVTPLIKDEIEGTVNLWHSVYYTYACYRGNNCWHYCYSTLRWRRDNLMYYREIERGYCPKQGFIRSKRGVVSFLYNFFTRSQERIRF